jgi:hypothetical protein
MPTYEKVGMGDVERDDSLSEGMSLTIVEVDGTADGCSDGKSDKLDDGQTLCSKHMLSKPNLSE